MKKLQEDADLELAKDAFGKSELNFRQRSNVKTQSSFLSSINLVFQNTHHFPFRKIETVQ